MSLSCVKPVTFKDDQLDEAPLTAPDKLLVPETLRFCNDAGPCTVNVALVNIDCALIKVVLIAVCTVS